MSLLQLMSQKNTKPDPFQKLLQERAKDTKCPDIRLSRKNFEAQDYEALMHKLQGDDDEKQQQSGDDIKRVHVVHISDTHMDHLRMDIPFKEDRINLLVHSGDFSFRSELTESGGIPQQIADFREWFAALP